MEFFVTLINDRKSLTKGTKSLIVDVPGFA